MYGRSIYYLLHVMYTIHYPNFVCLSPVLGMDLAPPGPGQNWGQNAKNMSFENISNLYKELGYDSTHHCDIVAGSLYKITSSLKFSLVSVVGGLGTPWDPELAESLLLPY